MIHLYYMVEKRNLEYWMWKNTESIILSILFIQIILCLQET